MAVIALNIKPMKTVIVLLLIIGSLFLCSCEKQSLPETGETVIQETDETKRQEKESDFITDSQESSSEEAIHVTKISFDDTSDVWLLPGATTKDARVTVTLKKSWSTPGMTFGLSVKTLRQRSLAV